MAEDNKPKLTSLDDVAIPMPAPPPARMGGIVDPSIAFPGIKRGPCAPGRRRYQPIVETEPEEDGGDDLEFTHYTYRCDDVESANEGASALISLLDDGWTIEDKIVAAPFVTVLFSRVADDEE